MRLSTAVACLMAATALVATGCSQTIDSYPAITTDPTQVETPGRVVWVDLLTGDLDGAKAFYGGMFGWTFESVPGIDDYILIRADGERMGGILEVDSKEHDNVSQWLSYISVADVDVAVDFYESNGGELHHGPIDIPGRGRAALVTDPQGAYVALLRADGGDPLEGREPGQNHFMWVDYVADDMDAAADFLGSAFGWKAEVWDRSETGQYYVFKQGDKPRAGMFLNPWSEHVRPNWLPYVRVADAAAAVERAESLGAKVVLAPTEEIRQGSVGIVIDPSGAGLALQKYPF